MYFEIQYEQIILLGIVLFTEKLNNIESNLFICLSFILAPQVCLGAGYEKNERASFEEDGIPVSLRSRNEE